jgi:hypothetical protein
MRWHLGLFSFLEAANEDIRPHHPTSDEKKGNPHEPLDSTHTLGVPKNEPRTPAPLTVRTMCHTNHYGFGYHAKKQAAVYSHHLRHTGLPM